ncbi:alpha/beta fold hydrolase [Baekduia soli]|uniref:alpha/beta fold hydrolase n=1 Tax=Baekduia soli TaxID=496014 RepID=UPI00165244DD|nr:alpha/beta fold hydrolase [Baekduia soli]
MPETLVLLHGFAGTHRAWDLVVPELDRERYRPILPDLRGHGTKGTVRAICFDDCVRDVLAQAPERFALCGYSFGGRVAQHVALQAPGRVTRLVLVSTSGGLEDPAERAARRAEDEALADEVAGMSGERFADRWQAQPVFAGTPPEAARWWRADLLRNDPRGLAEALRTLGPGAMEPVWSRLAALTMPVTVVVGERDAKFLAHARRYLELLPDARLVVIPGAGHGLPREAPAELAAAIADRPA